MDSSITELKELFQLVKPAITAASNVKMIYKKVQSFREERFNENLQMFLREIETTTDTQRIEFIKKLNSDQTKFWENILLQLDTINEPKKFTIKGKLCHSLILKHISAETFERLSQIIERLFIEDIKTFHMNYKKRAQHKDKIQEIYIPFYNTESNKLLADTLVSNGLLKPERIGAINIGGMESIFGHEPTSLGTALLNYAF